MYLSLRDRPAAVRGRAARTSSTVVTLGVVSMLTDISSEAVAAVLPLYLTAAMGLSVVAYGVIDGLFVGAGALLRVAGGWASDRLDRPKWVAFVGYLLSALTRIGLLLASGAAAVAALVTVDRLGKGIRTAPRDALITATSPEASLGRAFGVHRTLDTVGAAAGPLLAFGVLALIPDGYTSVFVLSFGFAVLGVVALGVLVPDRRPRRERQRDAGTLPSLRWRQFLDPRLRRLLAAMAVLGLLTVGDGFVYLALQARDGFAAHWFPLLFVGTNAAYIALAVPLGRLADRLGRTRLLVLGHAALLGTYLCAALPLGRWWSTLLCLALLGAFYASTDGVLSAVAGALVDPAVRGSAIGSAQAVVGLARMLSAMGFGLLWYAAGRGAALLAVAAALAVAVPLCYRALRHLDGSGARAASGAGR